MNKIIKRNHSFDDNELVYLYQHESSIKAKALLFEKYKSKLLIATIAYFKKWYKLIPFDSAELLSIVFQNFSYALDCYKVSNRKFNFMICLFVVNHSELRKIAYYYAISNGQRVLTTGYSWNDEIINSSTHSYPITTVEDTNRTENKIYYDNLMFSIKNLLINKSLITKIVYTLYALGISPIQIANILKIKLNKIYFIIYKYNNMVKRINHI